MRYEEISKVLEINGKESPVFMPNEMFEDLQGYLEDSSHIAYAYSYMYLSHFLYRNCKYFNVPTLLDNNMLKEILGYSKSNRTMNYITKKDGLLNGIKYTEPTKNYPMSWEYTDKELSFLTYEDSRDYMDVLPPIPKKFFLNYPLLAEADERVVTKVVTTETGEKIEEEVEVRGTFHDVESTTSVDFKVFMFCMGKKDLGVIAFYLYSWFKYSCNIHYGDYDVPITKLVKETGFVRNTIFKYIDLLKGYKMISFQHNMDFFSVAAFKEDRLATTYFVNEYDLFSDKYVEFEKMEVLLKMDYIEMKAYEEDAQRDADKKNGILIKQAKKQLYIPNCKLPY